MKQKNLGFKNSIILFIKNILFRILHLFAIKKLKKIAKNSKIKPIIKNDGKKILFNTLYGMYGGLVYWEVALAKALQLRGHDVKMLTCGKAFNMCTSEYTVHRFHNDRTCKHCIDFSSDFFKTVNIPYETYAQYITKEEIEQITIKINKLSKEECIKYFFKEVDIGTLSLNAANRYFKGMMNPDSKLFLEVLHSELINGLISINVAEKIYKEWKPDVLVSIHLGYSSWGGLAEYMIQRGIRVCSWGNGYKNTTLFFDRDKAKTEFFKYFKEKRKNKFLNPDEEAELNTFLNKRFKGLEGDTANYEFTQFEIEEREFNFDNYKKIFAIFPNVPWDSSLLNANIVFNDVHEWVSFTIDLFKERPDYLLLIKIHPSETKVMKSEHTILDYIKGKYKDLPDNIKIIPPDTKISPYSLFPHIDKGLVYNGTIGLEMVLNNIPVVVGGFTHYREQGFTFDAISKEGYKNLIFQELKVDKKQRDLAKVYAYYYFIKSFIPFIYVTRKKIKVGWNIKSLDEFKEGDNKYLDHICDYITEGIVYQDW